MREVAPGVVCLGTPTFGWYAISPTCRLAAVVSAVSGYRPQLGCSSSAAGKRPGCLLSAVVLRPEASEGGEQRLGCRVAIDLVAEHGYEQLQSLERTEHKQR